MVVSYQRVFLQGVLCSNSSLGLHVGPSLVVGVEGFIGPWLLVWGFFTDKVCRGGRAGAASVAGVLVVKAGFLELGLKMVRWLAWEGVVLLFPYALFLF